MRTDTVDRHSSLWCGIDATYEVYYNIRCMYNISNDTAGEMLLSPAAVVLYVFY